MENIDLALDLEKTPAISFQPNCLRQKSNWSKSSDSFKFDKENFDPQQFLNEVQNYSPKLHSLLEKIDALDKSDMQKDGHHYKHFIFCDLKSGTYGAKMLASALISKGMTLGYVAPILAASKNNQTEKKEKTERKDTPRPLSRISVKKGKKMVPLSPIQESESDSESLTGGKPKSNRKKKKEKRYGKIDFLDISDLKKTKSNNFFLLSSVDVYDQPISAVNKKRILQTFNERPANIYGENIRFIIMDSGFKEGIDLFDIKYVHIFEPSVNSADQKQVIGRGTRTCGQKGLQFHPTQGWPLYVFIYDLKIPEQMRPSFLKTDTAYNLYLKSLNVDLRMYEFAADLESTVIFGSVDYELNQNIHSFSTGKADEEEKEKMHGGAKKLVVDRSLPPLIINTKRAVTGFREMRQYIRDHFSENAWEPAKMENLCEEKKVGGASTLIKYSPTQDFVRRYFTPQAPVKGMLLWHSVGTGKTCSAIAAATSSFEPQGYTILWVTRTTLKSDIWKNMFDQICSEAIRMKLEREGVVIPDDPAKRMKLLSKSWKIRPMSYKQFSNLVSKENNYYKTLVGINGSIDPLRKTLLIIDEAHKLYGGGESLSAMERPDMKALHKSIMHSYAVSGEDSVRVLLMTATPITENPMELVQLINLGRSAENQLPEDFTTFAENYLDETGKFTATGKTDFLDSIAGHVSYLNREKDARQFSQPRIQYIFSNIIPDVQTAMAMDKRFARSVFTDETNLLKKKIQDENAKIDEELKELDASTFYGMKDVCDKHEGTRKKRCIKIANRSIRDLVKEAKGFAKNIRESVKEIRKEIKNKNVFKTQALKDIGETLSKNPEDFNKFKNSMYFQLKYKCGKRVSSKKNVPEELLNYPEVAHINQELEGYDSRIKQLNAGLQASVNAHTARMKRIKVMLRSPNINDLEKSVLRLTMIDARKSFKASLNGSRKTMQSEIKELAGSKKTAEKRKIKTLATLKKTLKKNTKKELSVKKDADRAAKKLRKTQRKQGELREEIKNDLLKGVAEKYARVIEDDLESADQMAAVKEQEKSEKKAAKEQEKSEKKAAKVEEKAEKRAAKEEEKAEKRAAKVEEKAEKQEAKKQEREKEKDLRKTQKEREKMEKKQQKEQERAARKTAKNKK